MKKKVLCLFSVLLITAAFCGCNNETAQKTSSPAISAPTENSAQSSSGSEKAESEESSQVSDEDESIYISDDPYEYRHYLGKWNDTKGSDFEMILTTDDDKIFKAVITKDGKEGTVEGEFEKENGGIHYKGKFDGADCEGYFRVDKTGMMKIKDIKGNIGSGMLLMLDHF